MSAAYNCELAWRSIHLLATLPGNLRERLPEAWDEGMCNIPPNSLPDECRTAKRGLTFLRQEFSAVREGYYAEKFGCAFASVQRRHHSPTLTKLAETMLDVKADLDRQFEFEKQGKMT